MIDGLNGKENLPEVQSGEPNLLHSDAESERAEVGQNAVSETRVVELKSLMAQKDEELAKAAARLTDLEGIVASREEEIANLKQSKADLEERLTGAVTSYKSLVLQTNPGVVEELVSGDTIEAINESLTKAKTLVGKVRQGLAAEISVGKIPAGAPQRIPPDLSALSPREKIQYAIGGKK